MTQRGPKVRRYAGWLTLKTNERGLSEPSTRSPVMDTTSTLPGATLMGTRQFTTSANMPWRSVPSSFRGEIEGLWSMFTGGGWLPLCWWLKVGMPSPWLTWSWQTRWENLWCSLQIQTIPQALQGGKDKDRLTLMRRRKLWLLKPDWTLRETQPRGLKKERQPSPRGPHVGPWGISWNWELLSIGRHWKRRRMRRLKQKEVTSEQESRPQKEEERKRWDHKPVQKSEVKVVGTFSRALWPGGGRAPTAERETPRPAAEGDDAAAVEVPRREVRLRSRGRRLDKPADVGLCEPSDTPGASSSGHGRQEPSRTHDVGASHRSPADRPTGAVGRSSRPKAVKALETSLSDQSWMTARHQELLPAQGASLTGEPERRRAAKAELGAQKLESVPQQIGTRRRGGEQAKAPRDANPKSGREEEARRNSAGDHKRESRSAGGFQEESRRLEKSAKGQIQRERKRPPAELEEAKKRRLVEEGRERGRSPKVSEGEESDSWETRSRQSSIASTKAEPSDLEKLSVMKAWLKDQDTGGLSISQSGALVALIVWRSGAGLGTYLERCLEPGSGSGPRKRRQRSLLPLPLKEDTITEMKKLFETGGYKRLAGTWSERKGNKEKAQKVARRTGMLIWHGLLVTMLNVMWTGGGKKGDLHQGPVSKSQELASDRLWQAVKTFVDDTSESNEKVPKAPQMGEWGKKLGDVRISYQGEVIEKAQRLTLAQVLPGLPPPGYGASVPLIDLVEGELKEKLLNPEGNLLPEDELPDQLPEPPVHADPEQWEMIVKALHDRGLVEPVEDPVLVKGRPLRNGSFGVIKPHKFIEDERPVLRLIMDFRGTNNATKILEGDVKSLTGAPALQHVVLPGGQALRLSADDLVAAFYLFRLPQGWSRMMTFLQKVSWKALGFDRAGEVLVGATVLPMGWSSAVGVLQHAHRRLALRSPLAGGAGLLDSCEIWRDSVFPDLEVEDKVWSLYLDDTNLMEVMSSKVGKELEGKPSEEQERLRKAYAHWGIAVNAGKALVRSPQAEKLGAVIDGDLGQLRGSMKRGLDSMGLAFWMLRQEEVPRKAVQVFLGREVHTMQFRRPLFSHFLTTCGKRWAMEDRWLSWGQRRWRRSYWPVAVSPWGFLTWGRLWTKWWRHLTRVNMEEVWCTATGWPPKGSKMPMQLKKLCLKCQRDLWV